MGLFRVSEKFRVPGFRVSGLIGHGGGGGLGLLLHESDLFPRHSSIAST